MSFFGDLFDGTSYEYRVGDCVCLAGSSQIYEIQWRGYLVLGEPGQRKRYPVYWLGENCWDCHFEDELVDLSLLPF